MTILKKFICKHPIRRMHAMIIKIKQLVKKSFRYKIILLVVLMVMLPLLLFGAYLSHFVYNNLLTQNLSRELKIPLNQVTESIIPKYRIIDNSFNLFLSNQRIRSNLLKLNRESQTDALKLETRSDIESQLKNSVIHNYGWNSGLLKSIFVFENEDNFFYLHQDYDAGENFIADHINLYKNFEHRSTNRTTILSSKENNTINFIRNIKPLLSDETIGTLVLTISESELNNKLIASLKDKNTIAFIIDKDNTIIYHTDSYKIGSTFKIKGSLFKITNSNKPYNYNNKTYYVASQNVKDLGLTSIIMVPTNEITSTSIMKKYTFTIFTTIFLALLISFYATTNITKPFKDLIKHIEKVTYEDFKLRMPQYDYVEFNQVSLTFNKLLDEIESLFNEVYKKQILLKESELKSLQAQINPHFIFNVLETISWEAKMSGNNNITVMVHSLGELLRSNFTFSNQEKIKIEEELKYVNFYLELQNIRFGDKISVHIDIDDENLLNLLIPKLALQTIVENAVVHGLENKIGNGSLEINIYTEDNLVHLVITDNGIGFDTLKLNEHLANVSDSNYSTQHIGLTNVNQRIKLYYGDLYGIHVYSKIGQGTKVSIKIPIDRGQV